MSSHGIPAFRSVPACEQNQRSGQAGDGIDAAAAFGSAFDDIGQALVADAVYERVQEAEGRSARGKAGAIELRYDACDDWSGTAGERNGVSKLFDVCRIMGMLTLYRRPCQLYLCR